MSLTSVENRGVSVLIPTYNSSACIEAALASVFAQTEPPVEILVMDDGSTDQTLALLRRHEPRIIVRQQTNQGVAQSRNALVREARGGLMAFLDHDDLWHPEYLATQKKNWTEFPDAAAYFTGHENFRGWAGFDWPAQSPCIIQPPVEISPVNFLRQYHQQPGPFVSMSFCCVPKSILQQMGSQPFHPELSGVDDYHLLHKAALLGPVVYDPRPLVAYRITPGAQSASLLKAVASAARSLEILEPDFRACPDERMRKVFRDGLAAQRREYGRVLMGAKQTAAARAQLARSWRGSGNPLSMAKSLACWLMTYLPKRCQPQWSPEWKTSHGGGPGSISPVE